MEQELDKIFTKDTSIFVQPVAGDTDSVAANTVIRVKDGDKFFTRTIEELFNDQDSAIQQTESGHLMKETSICVANIVNQELVYHKIKHLIKHKVSKPKWQLSTMSGKEIIVTCDHSLIVIRGGRQIAVKANEVNPTDKVLVLIDDKVVVDDIDACQSMGMFVDEYVYDIEVDDDSHTFVGNDILVHNSVYFCYEGLLETIGGIENMSITERAKIIERINTEFLNQHNKEIMTEYYKTRNIRNPETDMVHEFELETIAYSEIRLDVKKRYSQMLIWKDGKYFDEDALKAKTKGLEMIKASYPALARNILTGIVRTLLLTEDKNLTHILNQQMQEGKQKWLAAEVEQIAPAISVNGYTKYIISDNDPDKGVQEAKACPFAVRGLAYYNWLRQTKGLPGDPLYGGKMKYYIVKSNQPRRKADKDVIFTFQPSALPDWAEKYAPIDKEALFQKCVLDPFNRIMKAIGMPELNFNGSINVNLFGNIFCI